MDNAKTIFEKVFVDVLGEDTFSVDQITKPNFNFRPKDVNFGFNINLPFFKHKKDNHEASGPTDYNF